MAEARHPGMPKPGSIVRFRNRDWVLLPSGQEDVALLRPLTGTSDDGVVVHRRLSDLLGDTFPTERIAPSPHSVADAQRLPRTMIHALRGCPAPRGGR